MIRTDERAFLHPFLERGLNKEQRAAVMNEANCVVAAGAGSGKTFVFARRFAHLIVDKGFAVDTILALTFTKKAAAVMYSRIYALLKKLVESEDAHSLAARRAKAALENFHKARIQTLDSYCAFILRTASRLYGIRPDFSVDDVRIREFVNKEALAFTLGHKDNPSLQSLLGVQSLDKTAADFFAAAVLNYSTIARPFDFETAMEKQRSAVQSVWGGAVKTVNDCAPVLADTDEDSAVLKKLEENLTDAKAVGEYMSTIADPGIPLEKKKGAEKIFAQKIVSFAAAVYVLQKKSARTARYKDALNELRPAYNLLTSCANYLLHFGDLCSLVPLLQEFEKKVNDRKRASGLLSFKDISSLALRILIEQPAVRCAEKKRLNAIMIDEFQDNNEQQRDMLFLLAEKIERTARSAPRPDELCPDKLFFVGDEKQSIYLFRGADVSVFRKLKEDLASKDTALSSNYRSSGALIGAFNALFGGFCGTGQSEQAGQAAKEGSLGKNPALLPHSVFLQKERFAPGIPFPPFEAEYTPLTVPEPASPAEDAQTGTEASVHKNFRPPVHVCLLQSEKNTENDEDTADAASDKLSDAESEAVFVVSQAASLIKSGAYKAQDIAILFRTYSNQSLYEAQLRLQGIPYASETVADFFSDAPVNDIYYFLRLIAYPQDVHAFAAVLTSPFVRLPQQSTLECAASAEKNAASSPCLFSMQNAESLTGEERARFEKGAELYRTLCDRSGESSCADMVDTLWYCAGYRYETLWTEEGGLFSELYDYLYEIARNTDSRGKSLGGFVDELAALLSDNRRLNDMDIPLERSDAVHLIGIHKSKGLEFPVVFICGASAKARGERNTDLLYANDEWGISLNFPPPDKIKDCKKNIFFDLMSVSAKQKAAAELRRLLYVAFTRAEKEVYISGSYYLSADAKKLLEKEKADDESGSENETVRLLTHIGALCAVARKKAEADSDYAGGTTFFDFLFPVIYDFFDEKSGTVKKNVPFTLGSIPALSRAELKKIAAPKKRHILTEVQKELRPFYERASAVQTPVLRGRYISPSKLTPPESDTGLSAFSVPPPESAAASAPLIDEIVASFANGEFGYNHFGTIAHAYAEALFTALPVRLPAEAVSALNEAQLKTVKDAARLMAENFICSDLGREAKNALWRKNEYAFKLAAEEYEPGSRDVIRGQIDLVYESRDGTLTVVDFKTDAREDPGRHAVQLAVYRRAAALMRNKDFSLVRTYVYYLRSGHTADLTAQTAELNINLSAAFSSDHSSLSGIL